MIPVRVPVTARPVLATGRRFTVAPGHPLAEAPCPVCDGPLGDGQEVVLVLAGIAAEDRKLTGWTTGAAVAVHATCAGYAESGPAEAGQEAELRGAVPGEEGP